MEKGKSVRVNCSLVGKCAEILLALKHKGIHRSNREAISAALLEYWRMIVERELEESQLSRLRE